MLFNSVEFLIFFPIVVLIYFLIPDKIKYIWLLITSYYFYMCWNPKYALLILFSTFVTYLSGVIMEKIKNTDLEDAKKVRYKKYTVAFSFVLNLAILFFFKYFNFSVSLLNDLMEILHLSYRARTIDILLPVGISFYSFQALSYTVDVYRDEIYAEKNFLRYALFVSFFPQLVAGPIERSKNLLKQLAVPKKFDFERARDGILLMLWGFFLKIVLADRITILVDTIYGNYKEYTGWYLLVATFLFMIQLYGDFAGYSVIAMGAAKILGISLMENFNAPLLSHNVREFWSRWHISLTSWFRDYLYFPLGGSRKGKLRKYFNIVVIFVASGAWHGAELTYILWGFINGLLQVIEEVTEPFRKKVMSLLNINRKSFGHRVFSILITFVIISFTCTLFRAGSISDSAAIVKSIFTASNPWILVDGSLFECGLNSTNFLVMIVSILLLLFADICKYKGIVIREYILKQDYWFRWIFIAICICLLLTFGIWGPGYNSNNFVYFQF